MQDCQIPSKEILPDPVRIKIHEESCDFDCIKQKATAKAGEVGESPELLSWFDKKRGVYSPNDECCVEGEPNWLAYALAKKADLCVDVNNEEYVFMFRDSKTAH